MSYAVDSKFGSRHTENDYLTNGEVLHVHFNSSSFLFVGPDVTRLFRKISSTLNKTYLLHLTYYYPPLAPTVSSSRSFTPLVFVSVPWLFVTCRLSPVHFGRPHLPPKGGPSIPTFPRPPGLALPDWLNRLTCHERRPTSSLGDFRTLVFLLHYLYRGTLLVEPTRNSPTTRFRSPSLRWSFSDNLNRVSLSSKNFEKSSNTWLSQKLQKKNSDLI